MVPANRRLGEKSTRGLEGISSLFDRSVKVSRFATNSQQIFKAVELQLQFLAGAAPILDAQVGVQGVLARTMRRSTAALKSSPRIRSESVGACAAFESFWSPNRGRTPLPSVAVEIATRVNLRKLRLEFPFVLPPS